MKNNKKMLELTIRQKEIAEILPALRLVPKGKSKYR